MTVRAWTRALLLVAILLGPVPAAAQPPPTSLGVSTESAVATYRCAGEVTPAAGPNDIVVLTGSATKTLHVTQIRVSIESTTGGIAEIRILRRNTADSGGTSSSPAITKLDTNNAAATAVCTVYTANPGNGNLVSTVDSAKVSGTSGVPVLFTFGQNAQGLIVRGVSDYVTINGNGDTLLSGEIWSYMIEWLEY